MGEGGTGYSKNKDFSKVFWFFDNFRLLGFCFELMLNRLTFQTQ